jgi:tetratricopeptide (TPR) repeat protein
MLNVGMIRCRIIAFFIAFMAVNCVEAQSHSELRDSLKAAADRLAYHPDSIDLRLQKASWNMLLEEWDNAKYEYDLILAHEPWNVAALFYRAYANERLRRYDFARLDYENMLTIVPSHFEARLGLALLNQKAKRYTDAINQINILVQQNPDSAIAYATRAGIETERQMIDVAIYDYTQAIKLEPENKDYILARADLYLRQRKIPQARKDLNTLIALGVKQPELSELFRRLKHAKK